MTLIAIVADDLTSAGDGAAPFRDAGFPAVITFADEPRRPGVTAVDIDTRTRPVAEAVRLSARATATYADADVLVKTVDSTLRGHLVAEVEAALSASGRRTAVVAPAFPGQGRTTVGGVQHLKGRPVDRTWFARDPVHPVHRADLCELFPGAVLSAQVANLIGSVRYVVADAVTDRDLDALVAAIPGVEEVLWVGSPGLAAALARRHAPQAPAASPEVVPAAASRLLVVAGSLNPATDRQLTRLGAATGAEPVRVADTGAVERTQRRLARHGTAILCRPRRRVTGAPVPAALARATARLAQDNAFDALVLTGGETARTVLLALGARSIALAGELEPGVPLGLIEGAPGSGRLPVVIKAGGFGDLDTLVRLHDLLTATPERLPWSP
ncbi:four-carbon acid sugar kinase family protein [Actinomadura sp. KC06]|uniref:four-carbon acid sugar kinase family protein n=1 Tax=Actinomadura sp. KC06 TaxID=2530369 RepID=UPI001051241A|nr:four-carbon acid sugar kinase family protein [Actinomadura sp. KC06]TDD34248.1 four-carbon acid sugar kinase family protein [Actinomadura sp. KC06]